MNKGRFGQRKLIEAVFLFALSFDEELAGNNQKLIVKHDR
jgi:hypothetical protein